LKKARPILKSFEGWTKNLSECTRYEELPSQAKNYIQFIEEFTQTPVDIISVGPHREQTFVRKEPWSKSSS
jgi:adenylosuccinate synthase